MRLGASRRGALGLGVCGLCAGLFLAEFALGKLQAAPNFLAYSATRGWKLRSGARGWYRREGRAYVAVNADGLRGPVVPRPRRPGALRVAVLGDSFVEAIHVPYEQSFCAVLRRELGRRTGKGVEVLGFGVSGYGPAQEYLTLGEEVWRYAPDVVVLAVFTGNDVSDDSPALDSGRCFEGERCRPYFHVQDGRLQPYAPFRRGLFSLFCRLNLEARRSAVVRVIGTAADLALARLWRRGPDVPGAEPGVSDRIYAPPSDEAWAQAWDVTERLVAAMAAEAKMRRARFLAVTLSNPVQVFPDKAFRERYLRTVGGADLFYPERRLKELGRRRGFAVLALAPLMQAAADRDGTFFHGFKNTRPGAGHWNRLGHAFAGREIAKALMGRIPSPH